MIGKLCACLLFSLTGLVFAEIQHVHKKCHPPKYNGVLYSKYWANIIEIFTTELSTYLYTARKNLWKFNVKIVFYYMFSITRPKHKFP